MPKFRYSKKAAALASVLWLNVPVSAAEEHPDSSTKQLATDTVRVVPVDTLSIYSGRIVTAEAKVYGTDSLLMDSTTVTSEGSLIMTAEDGILVLDGTDIELGGELMLNGAAQYMIRFTYDASGNRIRRETDSSTK